MTEYLEHEDGFKVYYPMKISNQPTDAQLQKMLDSKQYLFSEKMDGAWYQCQKENDKVYLFSRTVSRKTGFFVNKIDNVPHIKKIMEQYLPNRTTIIGEIYVPGGTSKDVTSIMGCLPDKAITRQFESSQYQPVHYYVHDIIQKEGEDLKNSPFISRYNILQNLFFCDNCIDSLYVELAFQHLADQGTYEYLNLILAEGGEGIVLKDKDGIYQPNKRPVYNKKIKQKQDNIDLIIMECLPPEYYYQGKEQNTWPYKDEAGNLITKAAYYHWNNAFKVGAYDKNNNLIEIGRIASGLTDEIREDMGRNPDDYIGQVIEIQCMSLDKKAHTIRHGFFVRFHPDKNPEECIIEEIFR